MRKGKKEMIWTTELVCALHKLRKKKLPLPTLAQRLGVSLYALQSYYEKTGLRPNAERGAAAKAYNPCSAPTAPG